MPTAKKTDAPVEGEYVDPTAEVWDREAANAKTAAAEEAKEAKAADKA